LAAEHADEVVVRARGDGSGHSVTVTRCRRGAMVGNAHGETSRVWLGVQHTSALADSVTSS
jgi:hypothetical protein